MLFRSVPVVSDPMVHGTLWFFSDSKRDFSSNELAILEITAGRIAAEIEKAALVKELKSFRV